MLIPQLSLSQEQAALQTQYASVIEQAIANQLLQSSEQVLSAKGVFGECNSPLCGEDSLQLVLQQIQVQAPQVDLVILYSLSTTSDAMLSAELIDPLSFEYYDSVTLPLLPSSDGDISLAQIRSLSGDLGNMVSQALQNLTKIKRFELFLVGFALDEVAPFSTYFLSESSQSSLRLSKSEKVESWMSGYFPIMDTRFEISTLATESQFDQLLKDFFAQRGVNVVSEYDATSRHFVVSRLGNPYMPSLLSRFLMISVALLVVFLFIKRQILQYQLERLAQKKSADQWLEIYASARSPWFALRAKWENQFSYWQRLQRESQDLEKQAKLFFEAGDTITAKLFISKSLNLNADAKLAKSLIERIEQQETSQKSLSQKEQWVRNKVAKAMNNYRGNKPLKALRQSYEALSALQGEKKLKRQYKAIKGLIHKINHDFTMPSQHIQLNDLLSKDSYVISNASQLEIGRFSPKDNGMSLLQDVFAIYINHKALSRAGKHLAIKRTNNGFYMSDQGSTNGTFVESKNQDSAALSKDIWRVIVDDDGIKLGSESDLSAVKLIASVDSSQSLLCLRMSHQLMHTLDIADLARVWPDYMRAMRRSLVMTESSVVLAMNINTQVLSLVSLAQCRQEAQYQGIVQFELGRNASLSPYEQEDEGTSISYNNEVLLGQAPLLLPCELKWAQQHVYIEGYFGEGNRAGLGSANGTNESRLYVQGTSMQGTRMKKGTSMASNSDSDGPPVS
jgi:hypothetical protein